MIKYILAGFAFAFIPQVAEAVSMLTGASVFLLVISGWYILLYSFNRRSYGM